MRSTLLATMIFLGTSLNTGAYAAAWDQPPDGLVAALDHFGVSASAWPVGAGAGRPEPPSAAGAARDVKLASAAQQQDQARTPPGVKTHDVGNDRGLSLDDKLRENNLLASIGLSNSTLYHDYSQTFAVLGKMAFWRGEGSDGNAYGSRSGGLFKASVFSDLPFRFARVDTDLTGFNLATRPGPPNRHPTVAPGPQAGTGVAGLTALGVLAWRWRWRRRQRVGAAAL